MRAADCARSQLPLPLARSLARRRTKTQTPSNLLASAVTRLQSSGVVTRSRRGRGGIAAAVAARSPPPPPPPPPPKIHPGATKIDLGLYCAVVSVATGATDETENLFVIQHYSSMTEQEQRQAVLLMFVVVHVHACVCACVHICVSMKASVCERACARGRGRWVQWCVCVRVYVCERERGDVGAAAPSSLARSLVFHHL
jgi:hypothetical protein